MHMYKIDKGKELRNNMLILFISPFGIYIRDVVRSNQIFKMKVLAKTVIGFKPLAIFAKGGIVDVGLVVTTHCIAERFQLWKYKHYYFFLCIFKRL